MVSFEVYASELIKMAMGRLFKSFDEAGRMDCCAILLGVDGQNDLLKAIFGGEDEGTEKPAPAPSKRALTPALFAAMFG